MTARILWSERETGMVVEEAVRLRLADPAASFLSIVKTAQKVLPKERRRRFRELKEVAKLAEEVRRTTARLCRHTHEVSCVDRPVCVAAAVAWMLDRLPEAENHLSAFRKKSGYP